MSIAETSLKSTVKAFWLGLFLDGSKKTYLQMSETLKYPCTLIINGDLAVFEDKERFVAYLMNRCNFRFLTVINEECYPTKIDETTYAVASKFKFADRHQTLTSVSATFILTRSLGKPLISYANLCLRCESLNEGRYCSLDDEIKTIIETLMNKVQHDCMTNVLNHAAFRQQTIEKLQTSKCGTFFMFDIDYFKEVNDRLGHLVGDELLVSFAKALTDVFGTEGLVGRLGGDEFVVFVPELKDECWCQVKFNEIKRRYQSEFQTRVGAAEDNAFSCGVVILEEPVPYESIVEKADNGLYCSKRTKDTITIVHQR